MIGIVAYGSSGNLKAFLNVFTWSNIPAKLVSTPSEFAQVSRLILPGVGSFDAVMDRVVKSGLRDGILECALIKKLPVLGVCVGMQIMAAASEEGHAAGFGWFDATVRKLTTQSDAALILPHMGWNRIAPTRDNALLQGLDREARFYFLHSFGFPLLAGDAALAVTDYGRPFTSIVQRDNLYGVQFHPEKSHRWGQRLLTNFAEV